MPAPPDASQRRSQARLKVHGLRQGVGDKNPQGNGGVTTTSPCLCHRDLGARGCPRVTPRDARMLRARRSAGPRCDIDCGDTTGHGGGRAGDRRLEHGWVHPGAPGQDEAGQAVLGSSRCTGTGDSPGARAMPAAAGCQCRPDAGSGETSRKIKILGSGGSGEGWQSPGPAGWSAWLEGSPSGAAFPGDGASQP